MIVATMTNGAVVYGRSYFFSGVFVNREGLRSAATARQRG